MVSFKNCIMLKHMLAFDNDQTLHIVTCKIGVRKHNHALSLKYKKLMNAFLMVRGLRVFFLETHKRKLGSYCSLASGSVYSTTRLTSI